MIHLLIYIKQVGFSLKKKTEMCITTDGHSWTGTKNISSKNTIFLSIFINYKNQGFNQLIIKRK